VGFRDYLEQHFNLKEVSAGTQLQVLGECPFCGKDSDDLRLYVNASTGLGFCQHCSKGFSPIGFVMARERCTAKQAGRILAGLGDGYVRTEDDDPDPVIAVPWPVMEGVFDHPHAQAYLNNRNVSDAMIEAHGLGYCTKNMLYGDKVYRTAGRIIIPVYDAAGNPVGWQGRDTTGKSKIKYLFPPRFDASEHLFNIHAVLGSPTYVILCEGAFDVFGWKRFGIVNVLGTFGKKISHAQVDLLLGLGVKNVLIAWDSDAHWERDTFCEQYGHLFKTRIVDLGGVDADEASQQDVNKALREARAYDWSVKILASLNDKEG
jgi:hypothetical protein